MPPLSWKPAPQVLPGASCPKPFSRTFHPPVAAPKRRGAAVGRAGGLQPPSSLGSGRRHSQVCLAAFVPQFPFCSSRFGQWRRSISGTGSTSQASPSVAAVQFAGPGLSQVWLWQRGHVSGHVQASTPVFFSPDTSIQNMHLMTEARPSVESRCKWYSSWKYRWVPPQPQRTRV